MPKFGLLTSALIPITEQVDRFSRLGFDFVEIGMEEPRGVPESIMGQKTKILKALRERHMPAIGHTAYWVGFGSSHREVREGWIREAKHMIDAAAALKLGYLNFHLIRGQGQTMKAEAGRKLYTDNFIRSMKVLARYAKRKRVTLMLENCGGGKKRLGIGYYSRVIRSVPELMVHLDVGHAFVEGRMRGIGDYVRRFHNRIVHVHMHDNHGKEDEHLELGKGSINFMKVARLLKRAGYDGTITFEVFSSYKAAVASRKKFAELWSRA